MVLKGILTFKTGDVYDGDFKNGKEDGYGILTFSHDAIIRSKRSSNVKEDHIS